ncbi:MAG: hypothetical protein ACM34I_01755 [bacterium]
MKNRVTVLCAFFIASFVFSQTARAVEITGLQPVQPYGVFSSFSADTVKKGGFALGLDYQNLIDLNSRLALKSGYGVADNADLLVNIPYILDYENESGWEDIALGLRHRLIDEGTYSPSIAYMFKVGLTNGWRRFSTDGSVGGGIVVSKKIGPFSSHLNFLYSEPFDKTLDAQMEFSLGVALKASHDFDILGELYVLNSYFVDNFETAEARFGYRIKTADYIYTVIGAGFDLKNRDPEFRLMISINLLFERARSDGN